MKSMIISCSAALLAVFAAQTASAGSKADALMHQTMAAQKGVYAPATNGAVTDAGLKTPAASLCFTCGGDYPSYSGTIPAAAGATERAGACAGDLVSSSDTAPFLCSKLVK